jgi:hypothetical protein
MIARNLYSYYGNTLGDQYYFGNTNVNLTLLSGGQSSVNALSNLSPQALGGIAPAAGGTNPSGSTEGDCGNNYLDSGFDPNFNEDTCTDTNLNTL